jgi:hypothetical protein
MKLYLAFTSFVFGALTVVHIWRAAIEPSTHNVWFVGTTVLSAVLCLWAGRLWWRVAHQPRSASDGGAE